MFVTNYMVGAPIISRRLINLLLIYHMDATTGIAESCTAAPGPGGGQRDSFMQTHVKENSGRAVFQN